MAARLSMQRWISVGVCTLLGAVTTLFNRRREARLAPPEGGTCIKNRTNRMDSRKGNRDLQLVKGAGEAEGSNHTSLVLDKHLPAPMLYAGLHFTSCMLYLQHQHSPLAVYHPLCFSIQAALTTQSMLINITIWCKSNGGVMKQRRHSSKMISRSSSGSSTSRGT
jgi:hypothetical protein